MARETKNQLVTGLIDRYRAATNRDAAFDALAARHLGVSVGDLNCLNIIESHGGMTAGALAAESGLTTGAVTAVVDRLERAGYARRAPDEHDRRKVNVEVTPEFYARAGEVWGPVAEDWQRTVGGRFSGEQLATIAEFLDQVGELSARHAERLRNAGPTAG